MKIVIVAKEQSIFEKYREIFKAELEQSLEAQVAYLFQNGRSRGKLISDIKSASPDILLTVDLEGFEQCTLTDNISYNLLNCKQIHLLLHEELENEKYLSRQLSIAMFFYCAGDTYFSYLESAYPQLPYLKEIAGWKPAGDKDSAKADAEALCAVLKEVRKECRLH